MQAAELASLIGVLLECDFDISIETNGTILPDLQKFPLYRRVDWIFDYKLPSSEMEKHNMPNEQWLMIPDRSWIKYVIATQGDFDSALEHARFVCEDRPDVQIAFSACLGLPGSLPPEEIIRQCIQRKLFDVKFNLQIHKFIFPDGENKK